MIMFAYPVVTLLLLASLGSTIILFLRLAKPLASPSQTAQEAKGLHSSTDASVDTNSSDNNESVSDMESKDNVMLEENNNVQYEGQQHPVEETQPIDVLKEVVETGSRTYERVQTGEKLLIPRCYGRYVWCMKKKEQRERVYCALTFISSQHV